VDSIRAFLNRNPWLGWVFAAAMLVISIVMYYRLGHSGDSTTAERMSEMVTIRSTENGEEWKLRRGMMEKLLASRPVPIDPLVGLPSPTTGKPTGFPVDRDWEETIDRLNKDRSAAASKRQQSGAAPPAKRTQ
jgi:hypothetical protein